MRLAADRIVASLQRLDYADAPVWEAAQQHLLQRLRRLTGRPHTGGAPSLAACGDNGSASPGASAEVSGSVGGQVAAAIAAAAAALPPLPLEAEGRMFEEPRPPKKLSKPDNLIDVSDLDPELPRQAGSLHCQSRRVGAQAV